MKKRNLIILLIVIYVVSAITPYLVTIFYPKLTPERDGVQFAINLLCFFSLVGSSVVLIFIIEKGPIRILIIWLPFFIVMLYFSTYQWQAGLGDIYFFSSREEVLTEFVKEINEHDKIQHFTYNGEDTFSFNDDPNYDSTYYAQEEQMGNQKYWDKIIKEKYDVDPEVYYYFRTKLNKLGFTNYCKDPQGVIYLQKGGDSNIFVIIYSPSGNEPQLDGCYGADYNYRKINDNWFAFGS